jgi:hypothetical protein
MMARAASEAEAFKAATIALRSRIERVGLGSVTDRVQARAIDLVGPAVDDNPEPRVPGEVDDPAMKLVVQVGHSARAHFSLWMPESASEHIDSLYCIQLGRTLYTVNHVRPVPVTEAQEVGLYTVETAGRR